MSNDTELFELCKTVYEKTRWDDTSFRFMEMPTRDHSKFEKPFVEYMPTVSNEMRWTGCKFTPLYTSDYLFEKLKHLHVQATSAGTAGFTQKGLLLNRASDTPLKALLKLVLALDTAGVKL